MPVAISYSVGRGGVNRLNDVLAVQQALNRILPQLRMGPMPTTGVVDQQFLAAIVELQRRVVGLRLPDGRIDPHGRSIRALSGGPATAAASPVPPAPPLEPIPNAIPLPAGRREVTYSTSVPDAVRLASDYSLRVIERALVIAGVKAAKITSTIRMPLEQAQIMYAMATQDLAQQYELYRANGQKVLRVFEKNRALPKAEVIELMRQKIVEIHDGGERVSAHVATPEGYARLNVIDIGVGSTQAVAGATLVIPTLTAAFRQLEHERYIQKFIDETAKKNRCWHLEIVPDGKPLP